MSGAGAPDSSEFLALLAFSQSLGRNRLRTQGAGGNTSIKLDDVMWIKASGQRLADARERAILAPVALGALRRAALANDMAADSAVEFVIQARNPLGLRPSIETSVHAIIEHKVVAHFHCVETIGLAVRADARRCVAERLGGLAVGWGFIPYLRPGLPLARAIVEAGLTQAQVLVLGNHGLVVSGATVAEVEALTREVCAALAAVPRPAPSLDLSRLEAEARGGAYRLARDVETHALAFDPANLQLARGASLYPDHVIFLGPGVVVAPDLASGAARRIEGGPDAPPAMLVLPGKGVALHGSTGVAADEMALCLADVVRRIPAEASLTRLTREQEFALMNWDAEKYRQSLAARAP